MSAKIGQFGGRPILLQPGEDQVPHLQSTYFPQSGYFGKIVVYTE